VTLTLEYWAGEGGYVGRIKEVPGVFSQGETVADLEDNILDAYQLVLEDQQASQA
jgi:predicted RNase H-like HicB family nuclease